MFRLDLFRIRAFTFGVLSSFLSAMARGGLMFTLIIWLQGIWLPQHGYSFAVTPLWARCGSRPFATGGMICSALGFFLLEQLPIDFAYWEFAPILFLLGMSMG